MTITRSQFQRLYYPGLDEFIFKGFDVELPTLFSQWINVMDSSSAFEEDFTAAGMGLFAQTDENMEIAEDNFLPGFRKRYDHLDYTLSIGFSHQARRDAKINLWNDRASDMGFSARQTQEVLIHNVINQSATVLGPDGVPLASATHPNIRQGTQSNLLTAPATIGQTSIRNALTQFRKYFDDTGLRRIAMSPERMMVPPDLEWDASVQMNSMDDPTTANRAINPISKKLTVLVNPYMTDTDMWVVFCAKGRTKLKAFFRERLNNREFYEDRTDIQWIRGRMAFSYGWSHWRGTLFAIPA